MQNTSFSNFFKNKWVRIILIVDAVIVIALIALAITDSVKTATLVLNVVPFDAKIVLKGNGEYSNGTYQLIPGNYQVEISRDGLDTKTFDIDIDKGEIANITTYLTSDGSIDFYKQKSQLGSFNKLKEIASAGSNTTTDQDVSAEESIKLLDYDYRIMQTLPINDSLYEDTNSGRKLVRDITIRSSTSEDCETWLCIEALMLYTDDHNIVNDLLTKNGFRTEEYEIKYKTY